MVLTVALLALAFVSRVEAQTPWIVDAFIDMSGTPVGTQTTPSVMRTGTKGFTGGTWAVNDGASAMKVGPSFHSLPVPIKVATITYPVDHPHQSLQYDTSFSFNTFRAFFPDNNFGAVTASGFITFGIPDMGGSGSLSDLVRVGLLTGAFAVLQLYNGNGPGYVVNIETDANGTVHSAKIPVKQGSSYWYSFKADFANGKAYLNMYSLPGFTLVGSVTNNTKRGTGIEFVQYGNGEEAQSSGRNINFNYFEVSLMDYTNAVFPLVPSSGGIPPMAPIGVSVR
jgi:hypothetical protein